MLGFLVHDEALFSTAEAISACRALRTYGYQNTESLGRLRLHFFRNVSPNTYFVTDERYTIGVAGTLIFENVHGAIALVNLLNTLHRGKELPDVFADFRGPYVLIVADRFSRQVSILNSREGLRNCFGAKRNDLRAYSTNLLLLAALAGATPCADGIRQFVHIGTIMGEKTIFENVERLSAASLHVYRNERWTTSRLWQLSTSTPDRGISRQDAVKKLTELFVGNFEFTTHINPGRVAADLTGGTDTRTVLSCLMEQHPAPVASTGGPEDSVDVRIARRIAHKLGIEHHGYPATMVEVTHERLARAVELADGNMCPITLAKSLSFYDEKARRFDFITGGGGGPLFKDHYWLFEFNRVGLQREPHWDRIAKFSLVAHAIQEEFVLGFNDRIMDSLAEWFRSHSLKVAGTNNQKLDFVYFDLKVPAFGGQSMSLATQFMDVFHPMLDGANVQYSVNLPPEIRIRNILQFGVIRSLHPELSWIPTDTGLPTIPPVGVYSWLRILRARRYIETPIRKLRIALLGSSGQRTNSNIEQLRTLGYFDLLEHSSLAFSFLVSSSRLAEFKDAPEKQPNQSYLTATLALQLFFQRVKELMEEAKKGQHIKREGAGVSLRANSQ